MEYKAISVKQPYASYIKDGIKTVELRTWGTPYRGPILICSSKTSVINFGSPKAKRIFEEDYPCGYAICLVDLVDCRPTVVSDGDLSGEEELCFTLGEDYDANFLSDIINDGKNHFSWVLKNPRPVKSNIPVKGKLNIYTVDIPDGIL